jgi:site-specific recombinase XerC
MQKVESKKLEAKLLDHSFVVRADESSADRYSLQDISGDEELTPTKVVS